MNKLLKEIDFGNEAGDDVKPKELISYFVEQVPFQKYLDSNQRILLATAKKGVGKSALIRWIEAKLLEDSSKEEQPLIITIKGSDLVRSNFHSLSNPQLPNEYIRDWMMRICAVINRRIGSELQFAISDDQILMVESAELDGFKDRNLLSSLSERLTKLFPIVNTAI